MYVDLALSEMLPYFRVDGGCSFRRARFGLYFKYEYGWAKDFSVRCSEIDAGIRIIWIFFTLFFFLQVGGILELWVRLMVYCGLDFFFQGGGGGCGGILYEGGVVPSEYFQSSDSLYFHFPFESFLLSKN